jgi:hypothetical protein
VSLAAEITCRLTDVAIDGLHPHGGGHGEHRRTFARLERRLIGQLTREALAMVKLNGSKSGRRIGRTPQIDPTTEELIVSRRRAGVPLRAIADQLNAEDVPTSSGGVAWHVSTVRRVLGRHDVPAFRPGRRPHPRSSAGSKP